MPEEIVGPAASATRPADVFPLVEEEAVYHRAWPHLPAGNQPPRFDRGSGVALGVANHQPKSGPLGEINQAIRFGQGGGKRNLAKDVLAGSKCPFRLLGVKNRWRTDDDRLNPRIGEELVQIGR